MDVRKLPSVLTKGFLGFAGLMTVAALSVHLSSYGPDQIGPTLMNLALALFPIVFLVGGIRSGRVNLDIAPRDEVMERSPLPYPLSRVVWLQTALSPEACVARLLTPPPRSAWSLFATSQGLRGQVSTTEFRVEMSGPQSQMVYAVGRFGRVGGTTGIRLLMTFKRWPLMTLGASIVLAPLVWAFMVAAGF